jgi:EmrB/QacA subfamily drug resistance transporter
MAAHNPETTQASRPRLGWVLGLTSTAFFMVVLDSVVVITALPRMQRDLHAGLASLQWTLTAYNIAFAAGIITAAAAGDRFGRRRVFNIGLALFTVASAACALAPNAPELIAARIVQGLGAAIILPLSLTILTTAFPVERRGMIVGIYGGLAGLAVALGPIVGGAVIQGIDWHWIFWINVPIGAAALFLAMRLLPDSYGAQERLDPLGVTLVTGGIVAIVWALVRANQAGWASAEIVSCLVGGAVLLLAFAAWEQRVSEPMLPLRLFRSRAFAAGNATTFLMTGAIFAAGFLVTQEFQLARGYTPVSAGVRLLPFFATPMLISPIAGAVSDRIGRRPVMATGLFLLTAGLAWAALRGSLSTNWVEMDIALLIAGVGVSMALPTVPMPRAGRPPGPSRPPPTPWTDQPGDIMADHGFTSTSPAARPAAVAAALVATFGLAAASWVVAVWQMHGMDMGCRPGSARSGSSSPPRKSQTKSQRRPTSGDAQLRQATVGPGQVPTERH